MASYESEERSVNLLLDLYIRWKGHLLSELTDCGPVQAADRIRRFVADLERHYTDLPTITSDQANLAPRVLSVIAAAADMMTSVVATVTFPRLETLGHTRAGSKTGMLKQLFYSLLNNALPSSVRIRSPAELYLGGIAIACIIAIVSVLLTEPAVTSIALLVAIGIAAAAGASSVNVISTGNLSQLPLPEPEVTISLDLNTIGKKLSAVFRAADGILAAVGSKRIMPDPKLSQDRVFELLQAIAAHKVVTTPEKAIDELAADTIRLLHTTGVILVQYSIDQAHLFDEQAAGISERRTLLPALVSDNGVLIRKGVVLVPVT